MAINDHIRGLEVEVNLIDETNLDEYEDPHVRSVDARATTSCYIECASNLQFYIAIHYGPDFIYKKHHICERVFLDGLPVGRQNINASELKNGHSSIYKRGNQKPHRGSEFFFRPVVVAEEENAATTYTGEEKLGTITVQLFRLKIKDVGAEGNHGDNEEPIPEGAFKGQSLSHKVCLRKQPKVGKAVKTKDRFETPSKKPVAEFIFKYRSKDALKALHVIPSTSLEVLERASDREKVVTESSTMVRKYAAVMKVLKRKREESAELFFTDDECEFLGQAEKFNDKGGVIDLT
ncbi:MAG: hypothetical protein M1828_007331 [Chrysothrix sp. TS-e1954]|nr:MAG: hypothetical protein M1828_007331 [Chrysothrix sp. TS-e1954]